GTERCGSIRAHAPLIANGNHAFQVPAFQLWPPIVDGNLPSIQSQRGFAPSVGLSIQPWQNQTQSHYSQNYLFHFGFFLLRFELKETGERNRRGHHISQSGLLNDFWLEEAGPARVSTAVVGKNDRNKLMMNTGELRVMPQVELE